MSSQPIHGGRLNAAARHWRIPLSEWLDLSTGINPNSWPVPVVPPNVWQRLPEDDDGLREAIRTWADLPAGAEGLPVAGSQAAIQALPRIRRPCRVGVPTIGYEEHKHCWAAAGHKLVTFTTDTLEQLLDQLDIVIWIQPNNPTGEVVSTERLLQWHERLASRGGWLIVDEAFVSGTTDSLASRTDLEGLVVLRSVGKFFGLAGIRAGAVLARPELCEQLNTALGPWCLSGPTRYIMSRALMDKPWQEAMARSLAVSSARLRDLLDSQGMPASNGTLLFRYVRHAQASKIAEALARQGILIRLFPHHPAVRFGLPGDEAQWQRLRLALGSALVQNLKTSF
ncbi:threonine-phosphate decarboxylase CobD [Allohahella sp. A8]|uniref:threonine-phosphate decarboxylase CobD n=1 Tax=Allohahella sp. A8 TaxID=3141461 RepID=UPI003A8061ED